jgi:hypothetical protein
MVKINKFRLLVFILLFTALKARAEVSFVDILKTLTEGKSNIVTEIPVVDQLLQAKSIAEAQQALKNQTLKNTEKSSDITTQQVGDLIRSRTLTVLIVPGVLGEFIDTRAFEEVFARNSTAKKEWAHLMVKTKAKDERFILQNMAKSPIGLGELVNVASIDDSQGKPLLKLVILKTLLGSMESVGTNKEKAAIFNRRVQKYVDISKDENIVMLGYSRGTPLALEMVVQAQRQNLGYLPKVKALVSYAGVVSGSALADVTNDLNTESGRLLAAAKKMRNSLQFSESIWDRPGKRAHNAKALADFGYALAQNSTFDPEAFLNTARSGDFKTVAALIVKVTAELGLKSLYDFNGHVTRVQHFIDQVIAAVEELRSESRENWWKQNTLPNHIQYISLPASMVDPESSPEDKAIFSAGEGYSNSLDDQSLIGNMRSYKQITGVALNDSQVAVHQSMFLPNVISTLNPANANLQIKALGVLQTHHWGVSLQVVNVMKDGRLNPFPREKVLLSLAAYLNQQ